MERKLEDICKMNAAVFQIELLGNRYCSLALSKRVDCPYLGGKDHNGHYVCRLDKEYEVQKN